MIRDDDVATPELRRRPGEGVRSHVITDCALVRCDYVFPNEKSATYVNLAFNQESRIDPLESLGIHCSPRH